MNKHHLRDKIARKNSDNADVAADRAANKERHSAKKRQQQALTNLAAGGILVPKPQVIKEGLEETIHVVNQLKRPRGRRPK